MYADIILETYDAYSGDQRSGLKRKHKRDEEGHVQFLARLRIGSHNWNEKQRRMKARDTAGTAQSNLAKVRN